MSEKPAIISPLGAIPKDDGSVHLIHDGSLLEGFDMNEYTDHHSVRCQTLQDGSLPEGFAMNKYTDLHSVRCQILQDGSLPEGFAMNKYTDHLSVRYQILQDACRLAKPGYYCAKLDLQSAYRSVPIHHTHTE